VLEDFSPFDFSYSTLLDGFLKGKYNEYITDIIKNILSGYQNVTLKLFEGMDKDRAISVYDFLIKYKEILHLDDSILYKVRELIVEKYKDVEIIELNPSLFDLIENNIYKLDLDGEIYFVPLWHNEMVFESESGREIIVKCIPELPENISIDENNNIIVEVEVPFSFSLFKEKTIPIVLGEKRFDIPLEQLFIREKQLFPFKKQGISRINEKDIYNVSDKADIFVKIKIIDTY